MRTVSLVAIAGCLILFALTGVAFADIGTDNYIPYDPSIGDVHNGYTMTSTKCAVCHSVHEAPVSGYTSDPASIPPAGDNPEMLLRTSVADSCTYCHITTNLGGVIVYDGAEDNYVSQNPFGHQIDDAQCVDCHTVHGAGAIDSPFAKNLREPADPQTAANGPRDSAMGPGCRPLIS